MPKPYLTEFRDDVVAVAREREAPLKQIASAGRGDVHGAEDQQAGVLPVAR